MTPELISTPAGNQKKNRIMSEIRSSSIWYVGRRVFLIKFFIKTPIDTTDSIEHVLVTTLTT